ncbi:hypothetical protein [Enterobacter cancerogenus]|uniref:hypothetical protein n=1 Tax=Enterobacter cancerogenus TaxID=69218 RepID=UPI0034D1B53F
MLNVKALLKATLFSMSLMLSGCVIGGHASHDRYHPDHHSWHHESSHYHGYHHHH